MSGYPIIASITQDIMISAAVDGKVERVILMAGNIMTLDEIVKQLRKKNKQIYVHVEMVGGIGRDASVIEYLAEMFAIDGIVTTKSNMVVAAKQVGIKSIQRVFAIDSAAVETAIRMIQHCEPDEVELMPGLMPRIIREFKQRIGQPLIAGGLIRNQEEIDTAFRSGASYVSIGNPDFWNDFAIGSMPKQPSSQK
ncbi:glycerol uptake operon antiterminator [Paenibacillus macerans]|uniref:glycerol-3-phosphate responsive antiterminator n=1 Tax=Paenibacillus sp. FSL R5-0527 TaxID=2975321 RepID=UPI00097AFF3C|nr:glycerol-3-phosphate responsive antiterminator GlpP [Paenibacillus macerans]GJM68399.1 glycerol uptake operon antiterminator [Paenibacillus macerans]